MKKTLNVSISGLVFNIDDDAYKLLTDYLESINSSFVDQEEGKEIIADVEARIREIFQERLNDTREVITIDDVNHIIEIMGTSQDFAGDDAESEYAERAEQGKGRIYRDGEERFLGGVCRGLAHYFGIDALWIRLLFVVFVFTGVPILIYLLLWAVIPEAKTTAQKLEMKRKMVNINNIEKSVSNELKNIGNSTSHFSSNPKLQNFIKKTIHFIERIFNVLFRSFKWIFKVIGKIFGVFAVLLSFFGIVFLTGTLFVSESFFAPTSWADNPFPLHDFIYLMESPITVITALIAAYISGMIVNLALGYLGVKILFGVSTKSNKLFWSAFSVWIVASITAGAMWLNIGLNYKTHEEVTNMFPVNFDTDTLYINANDKLLPNDTTQYKFYDMDNNEMYEVEGMERLLRTPSIRIEKSNNERFNIKIESYASGRSEKIARQNAKNISYNWVMKEDKLDLDLLFSFPKSDYWRAQNVDIIIEIPENKVIYLDENTRQMLHQWIENIDHVWGHNMAGDFWIMTKNGLSRYNSTGKEVTLANPYNYRFNGGGKNALTDSKLASLNYKDDAWQGFDGVDLDAIIDMKQVSEITKIKVNFLQNRSECILLPEKIEVFASDDGKDFEKVIEANIETPDPDKEVIQEYLIELEALNCRYIRLKCQNPGECLVERNRRGDRKETSWLFADEIEITTTDVPK